MARQLLLMEDNITVIEVIKKYPILYDMDHPDYKDKIKKNTALDEAAQELNTNGEQLKKKWKNLRDCYFKHVRSYTATGPRLKTYERYKNWQWADDMEFFKHYLGLGPETVNNIDKPKQSSVTTTTPKEKTNSNSSKTTAAPSEEPSDSSRVIKRPRRTFTSNQMVDDVSYSIPKSTELSSLQHLMLSYAKTLETFSERRQSITKMKIAQIIMEAELEEFEEQKIGNSFNEPYYSSSNICDASDSNEIASYDVTIKEEH